MQRYWTALCLLVLATCATWSQVPSQVVTRSTWPTPQVAPDPGQQPRQRLELKVEETFEDSRKAKLKEQVLHLLEAATADPHAYRVLLAMKRFKQIVDADGRKRDLEITLNDEDLVRRLLAAEKVLDGILE